MADSREQSVNELVSSILAAEEEASASLGGALEAIAEFKVAVQLIEAAVALIDKKTIRSVDLIDAKAAKSISALNSHTLKAIHQITQHKNKAIREINHQMHNRLRSVDIASQIRDAISRLGF